MNCIWIGLVDKHLFDDTFAAKEIHIVLNADNDIQILQRQPCLVPLLLSLLQFQRSLIRYVDNIAKYHILPLTTLHHTLHGHVLQRSLVILQNTMEQLVTHSRAIRGSQYCKLGM